jgi:tetratricopeptide (TPR) repeat protein/tRNA A-37 threonylcarbamoyl transferase component Bud32
MSPGRPADEVEALAARFLADLQAGANPDRQALVRAHPHLAAHLDRRLALAEMMYRVGLAAGESRPTAAESAASASARETPTVLSGTEAARTRTRPDNLPDYEILAELGHGGMGVVYKARQKSLNRVVALKMIRAGASASPELLARFHIEAEALASLQHPHIVQVHEVGEHDGCPYMAMEFLDGGALADHLTGRPQPPRAAAAFIEMLARAMHAAHLRGIIHRDLKPANVLISGEWAAARGEPTAAIPTLKITDFGLAKRLAGDQGQTTTGAIVGTPSYMAPEQAWGRAQEIGPATDVYALGAILYEMLTGRPPFLAESSMATLRQLTTENPTTPSRLCPALPRDLETICLKCLEKEPARRYTTAEDLADDLHRFRAGEPIAARPVGMAERAWKWAKRRPALAALILVSAAAALAFPVVGVLWSIQVRRERDRVQQNLHVARRAIDDLYTKMASERLFDEPQLDPLRQELFEKARALYEELAQEHSGDPEVRRDIGLAWFRLGDMHRLSDRHDEAEQAYGVAIDRQAELCRDYPEVARYCQDLADTHNWLGELLRERGQSLEDAERHYRAALELQQELVARDPGEPAYRAELARSRYNLGIVEKDTNRLQAARADYDRSIELLMHLHQEEPTNPNTSQDLARALINRGVLRRQGGQPEDAGRDFDQAIDLLTRLQDKFPARAVYKFELAIARQDRGNAFWSQGQRADVKREPQKAASLYAQAQREHRTALTMFHGLVADFSNRPRYKKKLGTALIDLGAALASDHDEPGAEECWNQARSLFEDLVKAYPDSADYHALLGMTLGQLGWLRTEHKDWRSARTLIEQGIEQMRLALQSNPNRPDYLNELRSQYQDVTETLVQLGDHAAAVQAATAMAGVFPDRAQDQYHAACFIARCVPMSAKEEETSRAYIARAVAFLGKAADLASADLKRLPAEKQVFGPLATHAEFAEALRKLESKVNPGKTLP